MTNLSEKLYWRIYKKRYGFDVSKDDFYLTDNVPGRVKKSFELWQNEKTDNESSNEQ